MNLRTRSAQFVVVAGLAAANLATVQATSPSCLNYCIAVAANLARSCPQGCYDFNCYGQGTPQSSCAMSGSCCF